MEFTINKTINISYKRWPLPNKECLWRL